MDFRGTTEIQKEIMAAASGCSLTRLWVPLVSRGGMLAVSIWW
jgi:hypothetical protein